MSEAPKSDPNLEIIHARIQKHVGQFQSMQFAANIDNAFAERPQDIEHD
jgi:hypothetical protein